MQGGEALRPARKQPARGTPPRAAVRPEPKKAGQEPQVAGKGPKTAPVAPEKAPEAGPMGGKGPTEEQLRAVGLTPETAAELRAWIAQQQQSATGRRLRPEVCNHKVLAFMQQVVVVLDLRPAEVEARTGMLHQHQHRLKPTRDGLGESHVSLCTVLRWTNGLGLCLPRVLDRLLERLPTLMVLWEGMAA